jgi:hypothetical protein
MSSQLTLVLSSSYLQLLSHVVTDNLCRTILLRGKTSSSPSRDKQRHFTHSAPTHGDRYTAFLNRFNLIVYTKSKLENVVKSNIYSIAALNTNRLHRMLRGVRDALSFRFERTTRLKVL